MWITSLGFVAGLALGAVAVAAAEPATLDEAFTPGNPDPAWTLTPGDLSKPPLQWPGAGDEPGLRFESRGIAQMRREVDLPAGPFEFVVDLHLDRGLQQKWRNNGIAVALSTAPVDEMSADDWCVLFEAIQQGVIATARQRGARWGRLRPNDSRNLWELPGQDIAKRYTLSMSGGGGEDYSVAWPAAVLDGHTLRLHAWRDASDVMRFTVYHGQAPEGPWWEAQAPLPAGLRQKPLRFVTVFIGQEAKAFGDVQAANAKASGSSGDVKANGVFAGRITALRLAPLSDDAPRWNQPLPPPPFPQPQPRAAGTPSAWLPEGGVAALRAKFNDPAFRHYRDVLLRNAGAAQSTGAPAPARYDVTAKTWGYVLTGDRGYLGQVLTAIDRACRPNDMLPAEVHGSPGHLRQALDVKEFAVHRYEALAQAYDLLYDELDAPRRDAVRRALLRALDQYEGQVRRNDWWYVNNPSNTIGVGNGASGLIALALRHEYPQRAQKVIDTAVKFIDKQYVGVADDGGCNEGNMYWNYGMSFPVMFGYALRNATGDDRGLLTSPRVRNAHRYVENILGGDGRMIPFNDTQPWLNGWLLCALAGSEFDQPFMRWMADHMAQRFATGKTYPEQDRAPFAVAAFLFRDTTPAPAQFPGVPTLSTLDSIQEGVLRSDPGFTPRLVLAVKGNGRTNTHHANEDQGSFVLYADGVLALLDPGYFDGDATDHSLPVVGDPAGFRLNARAFVPLADAWEQGPVRSIRVDATPAYAWTDPKTKAKRQPAKRVIRVFVLLGDQAAVILDDVVPTEGNTPVTTQLQCGLPVEVSGGTARVGTGDAGVTVSFDGPAVTLSAEERKFSKEWVYAKEGVTWTTVRGAYQPEEARPLVTVIRPAGAGGEVAVRRDAGRVVVTVAGGPSVSFEQTAEGWRAPR